MIYAYILILGCFNPWTLHVYVNYFLLSQLQNIIILQRLVTVHMSKEIMSLTQLPFPEKNKSV